MIKLCPDCKKECEHSLIDQPVTIEFRGEKYDTREEFLKCLECDREFDSFGLFDPLIEIYKEYSLKNNIPQAEDIKSLQEKLNLNDEDFGKLFSANALTIRLYKNGAVPSEEHAEILRKLISE
jgi:hypothetical protein